MNLFGDEEQQNITKLKAKELFLKVDGFGNKVYTLDEIIEQLKVLNLQDIPSKSTLSRLKCQMVSDDDSIFKRQSFQYIPQQVAIEKSRYIYILCDLAIKATQTSDYTAYVVVGVGGANEIYLIDIIAGRWSARSDTQARELYIAYEQYKPIRIGIEDKAGSDGLIYAIDVLSKEKNYKLPIDTIKASNQLDAKFKRIVAMETFFTSLTTNSPIYGIFSQFEPTFEPSPTLLSTQSTPFRATGQTFPNHPLLSHLLNIYHHSLVCFFKNQGGRGKKKIKIM